MICTKHNNPLKIGLTGGIASGKSTVAALFADLGAPVVDTDIIAREIVEKGQPALDEIRERFGPQIINEEGGLERRSLRNLIFSDDSARADLEAILHPRISEETRRQSDRAGGEYQIIVVPLLVDSSLRNFVDRVLVVDCEEEIQLRRLLRRDFESEEQARRILKAQSNREQRLSIADDLIRNNADIDALCEQVIRLDEDYRRFARLRGRHARSPETP